MNYCDSGSGTDAGFEIVAVYKLVRVRGMVLYHIFTKHQSAWRVAMLCADFYSLCFGYDKT